jgi:hypothetical protein
MTINKQPDLQHLRARIVLQAGLIMLLLLIIPSSVSGQDMEAFYRKSTATNQTAMWLLGSWAVGNLAIGGVGMGKTDGPTRYFHQMNVMWNTVNLGIAAFGLLSQAPEFTTHAPELLSNHRKMENLFLINSGLDLLYIAGGAYMIHQSGSSGKRADLLKGYGQSVILQGGFLLVFDTAFWLIQRNLRMNQAWDLGISLMPGYSGIQMAFSF